ncbi:26S proteasome regulatory subunit [Babesia ovis]|uniref:26S proteasome regulatory subunit n=1 Tax=Babesia ovis TaxID=5869 RepID=A0A9W5T8Y3_BABOV|nr:26S proteasome regulatory subunit [Babesia ovis]
MAVSAGNINSENLISSLLIREQEPVQDVPPPSSQEPVDPEETDNHHRLMVFISLLSVLGSIIVFNLFFNLHPLNANKASERDDSALNHIGTFSTYYTGEYEICETARSIKGPSDGRTYNPGSCIRGNMHATAIFREMALDSFTTVYLLFCFELPAGNTFEFWKSPKYGKNTFKRDRRVYMGLSGLEFTNRIDTLYLSGMSSVLGPFTSRAPLKQYWPKEALKLDIWNEYFGKASGAVCSFNTFLRQPFPNMNQVSLRQLDEFYILGIRRYMLKDFEHLSNLDSSKFNIFNALYAEPTPPEYSVADNMAMPQDFIPTEKTENGESKRLVDTMYGSINSTDCGITISFKGQERDMSYGDILVYRFSVVFIMKSLLETFLLCKQLKRVDEGVHGQTISIIAFSMFSYQDLLEIFILLYHRSIFLKSVTCLCFSIFIKLFMVGRVEALQRAFAEASTKPNGLTYCADLLDPLKEELTRHQLNGNTCDDHFLLLCREVYEIGALVSLTLGDVGAFECFYSYLHPFYFDYTHLSTRSTRSDVILGLRMLHLLTDNRIGDFYMLLELIPANLRESPNISYVIELEHNMMEGNLTRLIDMRHTASCDYYQALADKLADTARRKIAASMEAAYPSLSVDDAVRMLKLRDIGELSVFMKYYNQNKVTDDPCGIQWKVEGNRVTFVKESASCGSIPSKEMLRHSLNYIEELEKIV